MNVEMCFVRTVETQRLIELIAARLNTPPDPPGQQPDWGLPSCYDSEIAPLKKRKVAVSPPESGWITVVESKEFLDFKMLQSFSETVKTDVIALQYNSGVGVYGFSHSREGIIQAHDYSEDEDDEDAHLRVESYLKMNSIYFDRFVKFHKAVNLRPQGWIVICQ